MIGARRGAPLAVGYGDGEMYLGSDALALAPLTQRICLSRGGRLGGAQRPTAPPSSTRGKAVERPVRQTALSGALIGKGNYRHFMLKEICEQPAVIGDTLQALVNPLTRRIELPPLPVDLATMDRADHRRLRHRLSRRHGRQILVRAAGAPAGGARYRLGVPLPRSAAAEGRRHAGHLAVGRDGRYAWRRCATPRARARRSSPSSTSPESTMARESDCVLPTLAGPEIGVASTKAFTTQLVVLACLAIACGAGARRHRCGARGRAVQALAEVPARDRRGAGRRGQDPRRSPMRSPRRATCCSSAAAPPIPIALEGALKLKEISYIHAEGYAAGEMKHGPIALIDEDVPVIVVAPTDELFEKTASNLQEAAARGGRVILISDEAGIARLGRKAEPCHRAAGRRSLRRADPLRHAGAAARLSRRRRQRHRRRPAAQPGEERDGRVGEQGPRRLLGSALQASLSL